MSVRRAWSALTAVVLVAGLSAAVTPPASAATTAALPWTSFSHVLADTHGHVYVTGGQGTDGVWVRNADGSANTTITSEPGASGMFLSSDGATLYVALYDGAAISAIDTTTLTETRRYAAPGACPDAVTVVGSALWFDTTCNGQWGTLATADLTTGTVANNDLTMYPTFLLPVPGDPTGLLVGQRGLSSAFVNRYTVSGSTLTSVAGGSAGSFLSSMALDPDGVHLITASGSPYEHVKLKLSDLTADGSYASNTYPNAVATSPAFGGLVAAGVMGFYSDDIYVYRAGSLVGTINFPTNDELLADGLAFSPDGTRIYAVSASRTLHVISTPRTPSTLTVVAPATATRGVAYTVSGILSTGGAVKPSTVVSVKRVDLSGTRTFSLKTNSLGAYSYRDVPPVGGPVTWTVSWVGDPTHAPVTTVRTVTVARAATVLSIKASASTYLYGAKATVTVHLGTTYNRRDVYLYARPLGTSVTAPGTLLAHVKVNSAGNAVVSYVMKRRTTFTVRFLGDYRYNAAARAVSPYVRAKVYLALKGYYAKSGSTYLFHAADPQQVVTVVPNRVGTCFSTRVQAYQGGVWQNVATLDCGTLDSTSHGYAILYSNRARGILVRIQASVPTDSVSQTLGATSAWVYLKFT